MSYHKKLGQNYSIKIANTSSENKFTYLGTTITDQNRRHESKSVFHLGMLVIVQF
jgi:hypothetical protein